MLTFLHRLLWVLKHHRKSQLVISESQGKNILKMHFVASEKDHRLIILLCTVNGML